MSTFDSIKEEELIKVSEYLSSGNDGKVSVAYAKIDIMIKYFLERLKECQCTHIPTILIGMEGLKQSISSDCKYTDVFINFVDRFKEYVEIKKKIKLETDINKKEQLMGMLSARGLN